MRGSSTHARAAVASMVVATLLLVFTTPAFAAGSTPRYPVPNPAEVKISRDVRLGQFSQASVTLWTRCQSPWVVQDLAVAVSQASAMGSRAGDFGIVCDGLWHRIVVFVTTSGGGPFAPGQTTVTASLTVIDPVTGDPAPQGRDSITVLVHGQAEVTISRNVRLGQGDAALVTVWVRCERPWVVADLVVNVSQADGTIQGSTFGDFGIICDDRSHQLDLQVFSSGERFGPGITTVSAFFDVLDPIDFDPVEQGQDLETMWVKAAANVRILYHAQLVADGILVLPVLARCQRPWVVAELSVDVSQGSTGGSVSGDFGIACDGEFHRIDLRIPPDLAAFVGGPAIARAFFTVLDPNSFDPVHQAQDLVPVTVHAPADVRIVHKAALNPDGTLVLTISARCQPPWRVGDLSVDVSQGGNGDTRVNDHFFACDALWHRFELKAFGDLGPFQLGQASAHASFEVLDPISFEPIYRAQATDTVLVVGAPGPPVVYDQTGSQFGAIISSDLVDDSYDSQGADDFVVPTGHVWTIQTVNAPGSFSGPDGVVPAVNVFFYEDAGTLPGALVASFLGVASTSGPDDLTVALSPAPSLEPGTYWVSVQADLSSLPAGNSWLWGVRTFDVDDTGVWQQPGDAAGTGNVTWTPFHDFQFTLRGTDTSVGSSSFVASRSRR